MTLSLYHFKTPRTVAEFLVAVGEDQLADFVDITMAMNDSILEKTAINQSCVVGFLILNHPLDLQNWQALPDILQKLLDHKTHNWSFGIHHYSVEHGNDEYLLKDNFSDRDVRTFSYVYQVVQRFITMKAKHQRDLGHIHRIERLVDCDHNMAIEYYNWTKGLRYVFELTVIQETFKALRDPAVLDIWDEFPGPNLAIRDWILKYPQFENIQHNRLVTINAMVKSMYNQPLITEKGQKFLKDTQGNNPRIKPHAMPYKATTLGSIWPTKGA